MDNVNACKSLLEEVYEIMQKELPALNLKPVAAKERVVGVLKTFEIALLVCQERLLYERAELLDRITSLGLRDEDLYNLSGNETMRDFKRERGFGRQSFLGLHLKPVPGRR